MVMKWPFHSSLISSWDYWPLRPARVNAYPLSVIVPGTNSDAAMITAMQRYPGYIAGPVRRAHP